MKNKIKYAAAAVSAAILTAVSVPAMSAIAGESPSPDTAGKSSTVGSIGSVSKMFGTAAAMHLVDLGKLDLDAPVTDYLPDFRMADSRYKDITVRMLMNHTSAIMGTTTEDFMLYDDRDSLAHDTFLKKLSAQKLKAAPGEYAAYCNDGFTLLELVIEAVSGESFSDYIEKEICKPFGLDNTGTALGDSFHAPGQAEVFLPGGIRMSADYCMSSASGGVISSAVDLSRFGKLFFTGNTEFLSENAKNEMKKKSIDREYEDGYGLGWDMVEDKDYSAAGVQIVQKGGDIVNQHASLLVAPDEKISAAVISSGGDSGVDSLLASAIIDVVLEEKGIKVEHPKPEKPEMLSEVPEKYLKYEDFYASSDKVYSVSFPDGKYMEIKEYDGNKEKIKEYMYTADDSFVLTEGNVLSGKAVPASDRTILRFINKNGSDYIVYETDNEKGSLGRVFMEGYIMQRVGENTVSAGIQKEWEKRNGKKYYLVSDKYSSCYYHQLPVVKINTIKDVPGYTEVGKIIDGTHLAPFASMPGSRDLTSVEIVEKNGAERLIMLEKCLEYISEDSIGVLEEGTKSISLASKSASWYNIGKSLGGKVMTMDIPENAAVYVFDRFDNVTYSSYMKDYGSKVYMPENGKIVFLGEDGGKIKIS